MIPRKASNQMMDKIDQAIKYEIEDKIEIVRKIRREQQEKKEHEEFLLR